MARFPVTWIRYRVIAGTIEGLQQLPSGPRSTMDAGKHSRKQKPRIPGDFELFAMLPRPVEMAMTVTSTMIPVIGWI